MLHLYAAFIFVLMCAVIVFCTVQIGAELRYAMTFAVWPVHVRKVGGLYFWRVGRLGGSIYLAKGN